MIKEHSRRNGVIVVGNENMEEKLIKRIEEVRIYNPEMEYNLSASLEAIALKNNNEYLRLISQLYSADALMKMGNIKGSIKKVQENIVTLEENNYTELLSRAYALLGIGYMNLRNEQMALNCFLKTIEVRDKVERHIMKGVGFKNISVLYITLGEYEKAEDLLERSNDIIKKGDSKYQSAINHYMDEYELNKARIMYCTQRYDKAKEHLARIANAGSLGLRHLMLDARLDLKVGKPKLAYEKINDLMDLTRSEVKNVYTFSVQVEILEALVELGRVEDFKHVVEELWKTSLSIDLNAVWVEYWECMIRYYKIINDTKNLENAYKKYYEFNEDKLEEESKTLGFHPENHVCILCYKDIEEKIRSKEDPEELLKNIEQKYKESVKEQNYRETRCALKSYILYFDVMGEEKKKKKIYEMYHDNNINLGKMIYMPSVADIDKKLEGH